MLETWDIMGVPVKSGDPSDVVAHLDDRLRKKIATKVAFLNAHLSNTLVRRKELHSEITSFVVLNDGLGLDIARKVLYGSSFSNNLNGTDFIDLYLNRSVHNLNIFILGSTPTVIEDSAAAISKRWPRHTVSGYHHGYIHKNDFDSINRRIRDAKPDVILVGMGNPLQEEWIAEHIPHVCTCGIAVGAWFDFLTQNVRRAPKWVRLARMEWLYRMLQEPLRLSHRYLIGNIVFLGRVISAKLSRHRR